MKIPSPVLFVSCAALALSAPGCSKKPTEPSSETQGQPASGAALRQVVTVDGAGFHPAEISAKPGQAVTLVFHRVTDDTCAKQVVFGDAGIRKDLPLNQDVEVTVTAKRPALGFACGMGMLHGSVVVR